VSERRRRRRTTSPPTRSASAAAQPAIAQDEGAGLRERVLAQRGRSGSRRRPPHRRDALFMRPRPPPGAARLEASPIPPSSGTRTAGAPPPRSPARSKAASRQDDQTRRWPHRERPASGTNDLTPPPIRGAGLWIVQARTAPAKLSGAARSSIRQAGTPLKQGRPMSDRRTRNNGSEPASPSIITEPTEQEYHQEDDQERIDVHGRVLPGFHRDRR